ncbi:MULTISPECIES: hypothetical protein [Paenibacillus]|uniref:hypothetical protein n=1 Tax=Paenibacillus TaxID=44249 RepID=UPI0022B88F6F|nr:hypothetical protein [Paenibacillus caseinilyticus]MCZ8524066.1 hypothetical protein [Paenibacillus caseinilyticus]
MENITAFFRNGTDMEQAAEALRKQGVVDLQLEAEDGRAGIFASSPAYAMAGGDPNTGSRTSFAMQILVESSRRRQAEDTVALFGGQY